MLNEDLELELLEVPPGLKSRLDLIKVMHPAKLNCIPRKNLEEVYKKSFKKLLVDISNTQLFNKYRELIETPKGAFISYNYKDNSTSKESLYLLFKETKLNGIYTFSIDKDESSVSDADFILEDFVSISTYINKRRYMSISLSDSHYNKFWWVY